MTGVSRLALLFPGQGSQQAGMGSDLATRFPSASATFEELDSALDSPISRLCFEGSPEELALTENTQPAILAHSVAAWRVLDEGGVVPDFVAGHISEKNASRREGLPFGRGSLAPYKNGCENETARGDL